MAINWSTTGRSEDPTSISPANNVGVYDAKGAFKGDGSI
jgi:hypothetical protein